MNLKYFTQPEILQQIGHIRVPKFLDCFSDDLKAANITLPPAPDSTYSTPNPQNAPYFDSVAAILAREELLPERLRAALITLEAAASPENHDRLQEIIQRRIPCISLNGHCPLDCALELWFAVPDELAQFQPQAAPEALPLPEGEGRVRGNGSSGLPSSTASQLAKFSCWCPKMMAAIGRLPDTLADRCVLIRMQRKTSHEE